MATKKEPAWITVGDRASVRIVTLGSLLVAVFILVSFTITLVHRLVTGEVSFPVITDTTAPDGQFRAGRGIVSATFTEAQVTASGLSTFPFAAFIAADAVNAITGLLVTLALAFMGWRLLKGDPFRRSVVYTSVTAASALILGPFIALFLSTTATTRALLEIAGPQAGRPDLIFAAELNLAPVLAGIGLAIVLGAFEYGQRLKADTEGLV